MKIEDVQLGDVFYVPCQYGSRTVLKGYVIEINLFHSTILLKGISPYTEGNFGALLCDACLTEIEAYNAL